MLCVGSLFQLGELPYPLYWARMCPLVTSACDVLVLLYDNKPFLSVRSAYVAWQPLGHGSILGFHFLEKWGPAVQAFFRGHTASEQHLLLFLTFPSPSHHRHTCPQALSVLMTLKTWNSLLHYLTYNLTNCHNKSSDKFAVVAPNTANRRRPSIFLTG